MSTAQLYPLRSYAALLMLALMWLNPIQHAAADTGALTGAISAKEAEVRWTQQDLMNARQIHSMLEGFQSAYPTSAANLNQALEQLNETDSRLGTIQQNNLTKLTITLGMETCKTVADSVMLGTKAGQTFVTQGCRAAAGAVAWEKIQDNLQESGRSTLGIDAASLGSPRTVKLNATNAASRAAFPVLNNVHHQLQKSLEDIKAEVLVNEGVELGDTGAILRKNLMVRESIAQARTALQEIGRSADEAKTDADTQIIAAAQEVTTLEDRLNLLLSELAELRNQLTLEIKQEEALAAQALITPETTLPPPNVSVGSDPPETYADRLAAAKTAAVLARWNAEAPPIMTEIIALQASVTLKSGQFQQQLNLIAASGFENFIGDRLAAAPVSFDQRSSLEALAATSHALQESLDGVSNEAVLDSGITLAGELTDLYAQLEDKQNRLRELIDLVDSYTEVPGDPWPCLAVPGDGMESSVFYEGHLQQLQSLLPLAMQRHEAIATEVDLYSQTLSVAVAAAHGDILDELGAAENELIALANAARSYANLMTVLQEARDRSQPNATARGGLWNGPSDNIENFDRIIDGSYSHLLYSTALANQLKLPDGLNAARELATRYRSVCSAMSTVRADYDRAWYRFQRTFEELREVMGSGAFPIGDDWSSAAAIDPKFAGSGDPAAVTARFERLQNSATLECWTDSAGNLWNGEGAIYAWLPLPHMRVLPDPESYNDAGLVTHRILAWRNELADAVTGWMTMSPEEFEDACTTRRTAIGQLRDQLYQAIMDENPGLYYVNSVSLGYHYAAATQALEDVWTVEQAYAHAHGAPVVTATSPDAIYQISPGESITASLWVQATGDFMTCQWQSSPWPYEESGWSDIAGATGLTLTTPPLEDTLYFRCILSTPGGETIAGPITVQVEVMYPELIITSPATAEATLGRPWQWQLTSSPAATSWMAHAFEGAGLPPGISLDPASGLLSGTPTKVGSYFVPILATSPDTMPGFQELIIHVIDPSPKPEGFETWFSTTAGEALANDPVMSGVLANPSGDGMPNLLKFALGLNPAEINAHQALTLQPSAEAAPELFYKRLNAAGSVPLTIMCAPTPSGPWTPWTPPSGSLSEIIGATHTEVRIRIPVDQPRRFFRLAATNGQSNFGF